jgi:DNA uptake protein ComE-like DNA-binding protein
VFRGFRQVHPADTWTNLQPPEASLATLRRVAKERRNSVSPASDWLPEGVEPRPTDESDDRQNGVGQTSARSAVAVEKAGSEAREWLAPEPSAAPRRKQKAPAKRRNGAEAETGKATRESPAMAAEPERIARLEETLAEQRMRIAELEATLEQREADVAEFEDTLQRREAKLTEARRSKGGGLKESEAAIKERLGKRYEKREAELQQRFDKREAAVEAQLEELEERLDIREAELRQQAKQREAELGKRIEELESALAEAQQRAIAKPARKRAPTKGGKLDLNAATFEQLRDLGLSVTLSARVISYRDTRGGFESLDELDEIPGLSAEIKRVLTDQLKL